MIEIVNPIELADLRIAVLHGEDDRPPAIAVICDSMGQLDLGWIEDSDAPMAWRAAAYTALAQTLRRALPVFNYDDLFDEISLYYWDGEIDDEGARRCLIDYHGADPGEIDEQSLPSAMNDRRPAWMIGHAAAAWLELPAGLREKLRRLRKAHKLLGRLRPDRNAWHFELDVLYEYLPGIEESASLPPMTLVPVEQFARELDDIARHGMEMGFMDIAGLCPLPDANRIDDWFASLRLGANFLLAAQDLIQFDPINL